jgi:hypothetical protein
MDKEKVEKSRRNSGPGTSIPHLFLGHKLYFG